MLVYIEEVHGAELILSYKVILISSCSVVFICEYQELLSYHWIEGRMNWTGGSFGAQGYAKGILTVVKTTSGQLKNHAKHNL